MKTEITDKDIERLFERALQQPQLIDDIKVHTLLYNAPKPAISRGSVKHFINNHLNSIVMSTLISSFIIATILWLNTGSKQQSTNLQPKVKSEVATTPNLRVNNPNKQKSKTTISKVKTVVPKQALSSPVTNYNKNQSTPANLDSLVKIEDYFADKQEIIELTKEEMLKFGITTSDSGFTWCNISSDDKITAMECRWSDKGFNFAPNITCFRGMSLESKVSFYSYYPVATTDYNFSWPMKVQSFSLQELKINERLFTSKQSLFKRMGSAFSSELITKNINGQRVMIEAMLPMCAQIDFLNHQKNYYDSLRIGFNEMYQKNISIFENLTDTLVPILVSNNWIKKVIWFNATPELFSNLPSRYKNWEKQINLNKEVKSKQPNENLVEYSFLKEYKNKIDAINPIELTINDLKKIGFEIKTNEICFIDSFSRVDIGEKWQTSFDIKTSILKDDYATLKQKGLLFYYGSDYKNFILGDAWIQAYSGDLSSFKNFNTRKLVNVTDELIPVIIKKDVIDGITLHDDVILWCVPSEKLFNLLPGNVGNELKQDYKTIMIKRDPNVSPEVKSKLVSSCKYFEECKATLFDVNFTVSPNPVGDVLNIDLELHQPETISISIFSISGRKIQTLMPFTSFQIGSQRVSFPTPNMATGFSVITIQNNKGQFKSQKIIKL